MKVTYAHRVILGSFIIGCFFRVQPLFAQTETDIHEWATTVAEQYAADTEREDLSFLIEDLLDLARDPLNINTAEREDLERIFFLGDIQIENILFKRYVNGPFLSIYELQAVDGLPVTVIQQMEPLVFFGSQQMKLKAPRAWGDIFLRSGFLLEKSAGFRKEGEEEPEFGGDRFRHYLRVEAESNRYLSAGFVAEKDPGEPVFNGQSKGVDLMSGYVRYKRSNGWLREALAGQYRMSAGQGLVVQSGMPARKSAAISSVRHRGPGFRPSLSASESMALKGGYLIMGLGTFEVSPFFSRRKLSGREETDSAGNIRITSIRHDGLYRTETELAQRHNLDETVFGGKVAMKSRRLMVEAGHLTYKLSRPLLPDLKPYNMFYFRGEENQNSWFAYTYMPRNFMLYGEVALDDFSRPAFWNGFTWGMAPGFTITATHRLFPVQYQAPLAAPLAESSSFAGEEGIYAGFEWQLASGFALSSYIDRYRHRWLKYQLDAPSDGFDWLVQLQKVFDGSQHLMLRYRHRNKPDSEPGTGNENIIEAAKHNQVKTHYRYKLSENWQFTTLAEWHFMKKEGEKLEGKMLAQDIRLKAFGEKLILACRYAIFDTDGYEARIYSYEPDVLYKFSVPAYSGRGTRYLMLVNYKVKPGLHFWLRVTRWYYADREETGSGVNLIKDNTKTEVRFQLRVKF